MEWLTQNWIWLALFAGVIWLFSRGRLGGAMGGCGMHRMAHGGPAQGGKPLNADSLSAQVSAEASGQTTERSVSSHRHGGGGCC